MTDETGFQLQGSAPERYEQFAAPIMAPFVEAVLDTVDLFPGAQALDLACGTGFVARAAAGRVGPTGHVVAVDINEGMLRVAAARAPRMYPDIEFVQAPADSLPLEEAGFDVVICQQGAQFFPDLDTALKEAARVLRPGGRIAVTTWAPKERSPYFDAQHRVIEEYGTPEEAAAHGRAFSCTADRLATAFAAAGLRDVTVHLVRRDVLTPPLDDWVRGHLSALPWTGSLTEAGPAALTRASRALCDRLADRRHPDGTATLPFTSLLATAVR
ncbi:ubiquinone/menaquinone biosynthesis methyltransferase [Streptomyces ruber]|uniref:Ubiquinone/menaquinone biosynthesis methyltransferase n=2 Tax=Streptomyces TaxID=1883 RepID=A0A918BKS2_9ACTN|nr:methyltransferase domain-containing protein [Streptomyces ruber]GGQ75100.1 ubiquinone/menaquinone biosynthesis methyltransferase [Streptomyces ruber]